MSETPSKASRTPLKTLKEALKERLSPEVYYEIFGDESSTPSTNSRSERPS